MSGKKKLDSSKVAKTVPFLSFSEDEVIYTNSLGPQDVADRLPRTIREDPVFSDAVLALKYWGEGVATVEAIKEAVDAGLFADAALDPTSGTTPAIVVANGRILCGREFAELLVETAGVSTIPVIVSSTEPFIEEPEEEKVLESESDETEKPEDIPDEVSDEEEGTSEPDSDEPDLELEEKTEEVEVLIGGEKRTIKAQVGLDVPNVLEEGSGVPEDIPSMTPSLLDGMAKASEGHSISFLYPDGHSFEPPEIKQISQGSGEMWRVETEDGRRFLVPGNFIAIEQTDDKPWLM